MNYNSYNWFFMNFANQTRMKIITALSNGPLTVNEIVKVTGEEQSNISHNLKMLRNCSIVHSQRKGKTNLYSLNKETVVPILNLVQQHTCRNCGACKWRK